MAAKGKVCAFLQWGADPKVIYIPTSDQWMGGARGRIYGNMDI